MFLRVGGYSVEGAYSRKYDVSCRADLTVSGASGHSSPSNCEQPVKAPPVFDNFIPFTFSVKLKL